MIRKTLDTNICSYILRRHPESMIRQFALLEPGEIWISAVVAAELRFGAVKLDAPRFSAVIESWLSRFEIKPWPVNATHHYANVRSELERRGTPIGGMDLMIAAHALAEDSAIITNNSREFHRVPQLAVIEW